MVSLASARWIRVISIDGSIYEIVMSVLSVCRWNYKEIFGFEDLSGLGCGKEIRTTVSEKPTGVLEHSAPQKLCS